MDVPTYAETLIVTDAAVNIAPTLEDKVDIIRTRSISRTRCSSRKCA
jgi:phosphotransacetylase